MGTSISGIILQVCYLVLLIFPSLSYAVLCSPGSYNFGGVCTKCPSGSISLFGATSCSPCSAGQYTDDNLSCKSCTSIPGTYSAAGSSGCTSCASNAYSPDGLTCINCGPGTQSTRIACNFCSIGKYSSNGAPCLTCDAGKYASTGQSACSTCSLGRWSLSGQASCTPCAGGFYGDRTGCKTCRNGTTSSSGSSACMFCSAGKYAEDQQCAFCNSGKYSLSSQSTCSDCNNGTFSSAGSSFCSICDAGQYASTSGCTLCPAGKYSVANDNECTACLSTTWSTAGSSSCDYQGYCASTSCTSPMSIAVIAAAVVGSFSIWCAGSSAGTMLGTFLSIIECYLNVIYVVVEPFYKPIFSILWIFILTISFSHPLICDLSSRIPQIIMYTGNNIGLKILYFIPLIVLQSLYVITRYFHRFLGGVIVYPTKLVALSFIRILWYKNLNGDFVKCDKSVDHRILYRIIFNEHITQSAPLFVLQVLNLYFLKHWTTFTVLKAFLSGYFTLRGMVFSGFFFGYRRASWEKIYPEGGYLSSEAVFGRRIEIEPERDAPVVEPVKQIVRPKSVSVNVVPVVQGEAPDGEADAGFVSRRVSIVPSAVEEEGEMKEYSKKKYEGGLVDALPVMPV